MKHCLLALVLLATPTLAQDKLPEETPYYPLKKGTTWTYKSSLGGKTIVAKVEGFAKKGDTICAKVVTRDGNTVLAEEHISVSKDGVYRHDFAGNEAKSRTSDAPAPLKFLARPEMTRAKWKFDSRIAGSVLTGEFEQTTQASLKVGDKEYKNVIVVTSTPIKVDEREVTVIYFFAKDVGVVKQVVKLPDGESFIELTKVEIP